MNDYNITSYFNDSFGIDSADAIVVADLDLDSLDSDIDVVIENSYH